MKILILPSWYYIGENDISGVFFKELAESLASGGDSTAVLYFDIRRGILRRESGLHCTEINGVHEFRYMQKNYFPKSASGMNFQVVHAYNKCIDEVMRDFGVPDIVHLESCMRVDIAEKIRRDYGVPYVFTEHYSGILNDTCSKKQMERFEKALSGSAANICISSVFEEKNRKSGHVDNVRIPNGVNVSLLPEKIEKDGVFRVKALGRLNPIKGFDFLIRGFASFAADKVDVLLEIGGSGPEYENLRRLTTELEISEKVRLTGEIPHKDIGEFYRNCSVFVCSSTTETFSVVTAEALCSGVPVISTRCGGPQDFVNEENGLLIDVGDTCQLADALSEMYHREELYDSDTIKNSARALFSSDSIRKQHLDVYNRVVHEYEKSKNK